MARSAASSIGGEHQSACFVHPLMSRLPCVQYHARLARVAQAKQDAARDRSPSASQLLNARSRRMQGARWVKQAKWVHACLKAVHKILLCGASNIEQQQQSLPICTLCLGSTPSLLPFMTYCAASKIHVQASTAVHAI
eukprot:1159126-Pelagomonas_calceolata.AAC.8